MITNPTNQDHDAVGSQGKIAADSGHLEVVKLISEKVSVKNPKTDDGFTPQELAAKYCKRFIATTHGQNVSDSMLNPLNHTTTADMSI